MRNKGAIVVLTIIVTALSLYYLSFTFVSRNIQKEAVAVATNELGVLDLAKKQQYLDSIWNEPAYSLFGADYTFKEIKDTELNLGLDLQGGMHVVLEVSPVEIIKGLSGNNEDPEFLAAIGDAKIQQKTSQESFSSLFYEAYKLRVPDGKLSIIFANAANRGKIGFDTSDDAIMDIIDQEIEDAMDRSFNILRTRIDRFGTSQPNIQRLQGTGRIQVEIPGADNPQRVRKLLQGAAKLEFWVVARPEETGNFMQAINNFLVDEKKLSNELLTSSSDSTIEESQSLEQLLASEDESDSATVSTDTSTIDETAALDSLRNASLSQLFSLIVSNEGLVYNIKDSSKINRILKRADVQKLVPRTYKFLWDVKPHEHDVLGEEPHLELHIVQVGRGGKAPLEGDVITDARQTLDQSTRPAVSMQMNTNGAKKWRKLTADNIDNRVAIVLDNYVYSAPVVRGEIPNGNSEISGNFTLEEAKDLANVLKAGTLPAPTRIVEEAIVGATLGKVAQAQGVISIVAGLLIVVLFMVAYYAKGGFVANFALLFNIFMVMGILAQLNAALTLPGIAGIVLTIGMSIDANVLIFERIREELRKGVALREAISTGYNKAFSSIIDSNITTFLTAVILYSLGQGPVKGFAITLMIGIGSSFFSAVYITRVIVEFMVRKGDESKMSFRTPLSKGMLSDMNIDFMSKRFKAYVFSGVVIVIGISLMVIQGLNLGVDFKGGRSYVVSFDQPVVTSDLKTSISAAFDGVGTEVKTFGANNIVKVTTSYLVDEESTESDVLVKEKLIAGIADITGLSFIEDASKVDASHFSIGASGKVGATIADDIKKDSMKAMGLSLIIIFLYIFVRFRKWQFGLGAVAALMHDTLIVMSAFAIAGALGFSFEIDQVFIAAILTIIGYSINDTVIVFDRIRENLGLHTSTDRAKIFNEAINSTLNRTVVTSLTTLVVVLVLFIFGGAVLRGFSFALLIGVLIGTYSSVFIAAPVVVDLDSKKVKNLE
jgi:SecD/SecF fusion protein